MRKRGGPVTEAAFGVQLRQCRQAVGLSLRQLATRVGYDHSYLSQVERGQRPGSADLARLCDRELGTGDRLTVTFEQRHAHPGRTAPAPVQPADPVEAGWHALVTAFGVSDPAAELGDFRGVPPARLLPELVAELRARGCKEDRAAQPSVVVAETLTGLGDARAAKRWWWSARAVADSTDEGWLRSLVRAREVLSGLAERRPLQALLELADEALGVDEQASARAARGLASAELGRHGEAHRALQELAGVGGELPSTGRLCDVAPYELHWFEGRLCARLGYGAAGCVLLARALELCPASWVGERAGLEMGLAQCLVVEDEVAAGLALALRVLVELPDEWHSYYLYDDGARVLGAVQQKEPALAGVAELRRLLVRRAYLSGRSVGSGS